MTTPSRTRLTADQRTEQLLDVAEELFAARGFDATAVDDIARTAGVTRPVVYQRLGGKEQTYLAVVLRVRAQLDDRLTAAALSATEPREQLRRGLDAYFAYVEQEPRRWTLLYGSSMPLVGEIGQAVTDARFVTVERIVDLLSVHLGHQEGDVVDATAQVISGAVEQLGRWWLRRPDLTRQQLVDHCEQIIWTGVEAMLS